MGIIVGLVFLVVAVVAGAGIWMKKHSGKKGREGPEFSCLTGVSSQVEVYLPGYWKVPSTHMWSLELMLTFFFSKSTSENEREIFRLPNSSKGPGFQHLKVRGRSL